MPPKLKNAAANDFFFLPRRDSVRLVETVVELCKTRLPDKMGIPADELQVLTPTRRGDAGTRSLNFALQAALNPPKPADTRPSALSAAVPPYPRPAPR